MVKEETSVPMETIKLKVTNLIQKNTLRDVEIKLKEAQLLYDNSKYSLKKVAELLNISYQSLRDRRRKIYKHIYSPPLNQLL